MEKINHPVHYNVNPSGVEAIDVVEHYNFNIGNAIKYLWRADFKKDPMADLEKAKWYVEREIKRRKQYPYMNLVEPLTSTKEEEQK